MLRIGEEERRIIGIRICRQGPLVTHLFFADDLLIFSRVDTKKGGELMEILRVYDKGLGKMINLEKSSVFFNKNVT